MTPVDIAFTLPASDDARRRARRRPQTFRVQIEEAQQRFFFPLPRKPLVARFDPGGWVLKTLKFERPAEMLRYQLTHDADVLGRIEAAEALGKLGDRQERGRAGGGAARATRSGACALRSPLTLGKLRTERALDALLAGLEQAEQSQGAAGHCRGAGRVPRAGAARTGRARGGCAGHTLKEGDPSYFVEAAAAQCAGPDQNRAARSMPWWRRLIVPPGTRSFAATSFRGWPRWATQKPRWCWLAGWAARSPFRRAPRRPGRIGALASDHRLDSGEARQQIVQGLGWRAG